MIHCQSINIYPKASPLQMGILTRSGKISNQQKLPLSLSRTTMTNFFPSSGQPNIKTFSAGATIEPFVAKIQRSMTLPEGFPIGRLEAMSTYSLSTIMIAIVFSIAP
jgi:hypothetical protein